MEIFTDTATLSHIDKRKDDKICWLIGLITEYLRDGQGQFTDITRSKLRLLPLDTLRTGCQLPWREHMTDVPALVRIIKDKIELATLNPEQTQLNPNALFECFTNWAFPPSKTSIDAKYRLFVEGETDQRMFQLAAQQAHSRLQVDLLKGITINPLGEGREGGTSQLISVVTEHRTNKVKDIFLFDNDDSGREAVKKAGTMDQRCLLLPREFSRRPEVGDSVEVEIEDLLSVDCLDKFYESHPHVSPELETIYYKKDGRRIVVCGSDKERLVDWVGQNATYEDLERIVYVLCWIRLELGLSVEKDRKDLEAWKRELCSAGSYTNRFGRRPKPWWYVYSGVDTQSALNDGSADQSTGTQKTK